MRKGALTILQQIWRIAKIFVRLEFEEGIILQLLFWHLRDVLVNLNSL